MGKKLNIIIVDDNEIDLMIGERMISRVNANINVKTFSTGGKAIAWLKEEEIDCHAEKTIFLIDIYLPNCSGFLVSKDIMKIAKEQNCDCVCYLLSATIDQSDKRKIELNKNIKGFIGKPITVNVINNIIEDYS
jgi:response regulator RpfG family c-di-GMP phosphodiesterase